MKTLYIPPVIEETALLAESLLAASPSGNEPFGSIPGGMFDL